MIFKRREHKVPGLNTTSTADISFMLLIFFLVTTNMDIDKGLRRQLPPASRQSSEESYAEKGTTMSLRITADSRLLIDDKPFDVRKLRNRVMAFVSRVGKRHLITISTDPDASYNAYFQVQNELMAAYRLLRDQTSMRLYGKAYAALSPEQKDKVRDECPQRIAEQYQSNQTNPSEKGGQK